MSRQVEELKAFGCEKIFKEKKSGKDIDRPEYQKLKKSYALVTCWWFTTPHAWVATNGRSSENGRSSPPRRSIPWCCCAWLLDTRDKRDGVGQLMSEIVLSLLSWMLEEERARIRSAQRAGIEIAKRQGKYKAELNATTPAQLRDALAHKTIVKALAAAESVLEIHRKTDVSRTTIYKIRDQIAGPVESQIAL